MKYISPWLQMTYRCNLNCSYCYMPNKNLSMTNDTLAHVNDYFSALLDDGAVEFLSYRIAGGEPLLLFQSYHSLLAQQIERHIDHIHVEFLTNLTFIPEGFIDFLATHESHVGLCISLDSLTYSKPDCQGLSSSSKVMANINLIRERLPNVPIALSTVITDNASHLPTLAQYVADQDFYMWDMAFDKFSQTVDAEQVKPNIKAFVDMLHSQHYPLGRVRFNGINFLPTNGCGAGDNLICIDVNGDMYPCQTLLESRHECMGNITGIIRKHNKIFDKGQCISCPISTYCGGDCKYHNNGARQDSYCPLLRYYFQIAGEKILRKEECHA